MEMHFNGGFSCVYFVYPGMPLAVIYRIKLETPDMICVYSTNAILGPY